MLVPLLEALVDGHPDVEVDLRLGDVVAGKQLTETRGVLLQHVAVVFPATALREHLRCARQGLKKKVKPIWINSVFPLFPLLLTPGFRYPTSPVFPSL